MNFPRCDDEGKSLMMCRSACENFFKACEYPPELVPVSESQAELKAHCTSCGLRLQFQIKMTLKDVLLGFGFNIFKENLAKVRLTADQHQR